MPSSSIERWFDLMDTLPNAAQVVNKLSTDSGKPVIPARLTDYEGIAMRSRLEAHWARRFDLSGVDWEYEPKCFASAARGQYLPDFRYLDPGPGHRPVYVETKGVVEDPEVFMEQMEIVWYSEPEAVLLLIEDHGERYWAGVVGSDGGAVWTLRNAYEPGACD